jgi:hypothetical protein
MMATAGRSVWSAGGIRYAGEFWFPVPVEDFWRTIEDFDSYQVWWTWLRDFRTDTAGLVDGNVLHGTVVPPLPYRFRLEVRLHSCERLSVTKATLAGDLAGDATMHFDEVQGGTRVRVEWTLVMASTPMRVAARVARPLVLWGHDRVVGSWRWRSPASPADCPPPRTRSYLAGTRSVGRNRTGNGSSSTISVLPMASTDRRSSPSTRR